VSWIDQQALEGHVGADVLRRSLDDDQDGVIDAVPLSKLIASSCGYIGAALGPAYPGLAAMATVPPEVERLTLDYAEVLLAKRRPTVLQKDWVELLKAVNICIDQLRKGQRNVGNVAPDPPATSGGTVYLQGESDPDKQPPTFTIDGFGLF
jgi:hypothetical protein